VIRVACLLALTSALPSADVFQDISLDQALKLAAGSKKIVLVDFYTTWCAPCKKLDRVTWKDETVRAWLTETTVALKIDAEKQRDVAQRYSVSAFPSLVFLRPDGTELDRLVGYREPAAFLDQARKIVRGETVLADLRKRIEDGGGTDVGLRKDFGQELARRGKHAEALEQYLWCWDHGVEHDSSFSGVRVSFLLGDITRLGRQHPPALDALRTRRDASTRTILDGEGTPRLAADVMALNRTLQDNAATLRVYDALAEHPGYEVSEIKWMRFRMYREITDLLLEERRYQDVLDGVDNYEGAIEGELKKVATETERGADKGLVSFMRRNAVREGAKFYEALLGTDREAEAREVRDQLLDLDASYGTFTVLVKQAARAGAPAEIEALLARARATLSEKEQRRLEKAARRKPR